MTKRPMVTKVELQNETLTEVAILNTTEMYMKERKLHWQYNVVKVKYKPYPVIIIIFFCHFNCLSLSAFPSHLKIANK